MKIGMLGTGSVGQTVGTKLVAMGHDVMMGARSADNEKVLAFAQRTGGKAGTFADAAAHGEIVINGTRGDTSLGMLGDRKSTRLNSSHFQVSRMPSSA